MNKKAVKEMEKLMISDKFTLEDIRKIREYNHERRITMTTEELLADIEERSKKGLELLEKIKNEMFVH